MVGVELGSGLKQFMRMFSIVLLLLVGIVFPIPSGDTALAVLV